jgi:hypothetical protein
MCRRPPCPTGKIHKSVTVTFAGIGNGNCVRQRGPSLDDRRGVLLDQLELQEGSAAAAPSQSNIQWSLRVLEQSNEVQMPGLTRLPSSIICLPNSSLGAY